MSALVDAINAALIHSLWQDTVIGVLLWTVLASSRRLATNTRYAIACTALALMAFVAVVCFTLVAIDCWNSWRAREIHLEQMNVAASNLARAV